MLYLTQNKHWTITEDYNIDKILYLLIDRPTIINKYNAFVWLNNIKQHHRDYDLPCFMSSLGDLEWCFNNTTHRSNNKPAIIWLNGNKDYYTNNKRNHYELQHFSTK